MQQKGQSEKTSGLNFLTYMVENKPKPTNEVLSSPKASFYKEAINSKIKYITQIHTWKLIDLPLGNKSLDVNEFLIRNAISLGQIDKYKARAVDKACRKKEGRLF